jgi:hypothetical protein
MRRTSAPLSPRAQRWLAAALGTALSVGIAAYGWSHWRAARGARSTVRLVDRSSELRDLLERGSAAAQEPAVAASEATHARVLRAGNFTLQLREFDAEARSIYFPGIGGQYLDDPHVYARHRPHLDTWLPMAEYPGGGYRIRTNSLGMREDADPATVRPDLRVLFSGDSHAEGVCDNAHSIANLLEAELAARPGAGSVEALNAGLGGMNPFYSLAVLEHYAPLLRPHVFVALVYGGNDFSDAIEVERWMNRRPPARFEGRKPAQRVDALRSHIGFLPQEASQAFYFASNTGESLRCVRLLEALSIEMDRIAKAHDALALIAYLPPATRVDPSHVREDVAEVCAAYALTESDLALSDRIADAWLAGLAQRGIAHVDLRPVLKASSEPCYWKFDSHLNLHGNELVARELAAELEALLKR